jgi:hypothetical protein
MGMINRNHDTMVASNNPAIDRIVMLAAASHYHRTGTGYV